VAINFLKALGASVSIYIGVILAVILMLLVFLLFIWAGLSMFVGVFMFFFWLLITHNAHTLDMGFSIFTWGAPPFLAVGALGYCRGQLRARRNTVMVTAHRDTPFQ
jgi:hypothetical protein